MTTTRGGRQAVAALKPTGSDQPSNGVVQLRDYVRSCETHFKEALPKMIGAERFIRVAFTTIQNNPTLLEHAVENPRSFLGALLTSAQLGLEVDPTLGQAWLIPRTVRRGEKYVKVVNFQPGYKGLMDLGWRSNAINSFDADIVWQSEIDSGNFLYVKGREPVFHHEPLLTRGGPGDKKAAVYAYAAMKDGAFHVVVWPTADVWRIRDRHAPRNKTGIVGPWVDDPDAMEKKTMIIQLAKFLPKSVEDLRRAATLDELDMAGVDQPLPSSMFESIPEAVGTTVPSEPVGPEQEGSPEEGSNSVSSPA